MFQGNSVSLKELMDSLGLHSDWVDIEGCFNAGSKSSSGGPFISIHGGFNLEQPFDSPDYRWRITWKGNCAYFTHKNCWCLILEKEQHNEIRFHADSYEGIVAAFTAWDRKFQPREQQQSLPANPKPIWIPLTLSSPYGTATEETREANWSNGRHVRRKWEIPANHYAKVKKWLDVQTAANNEKTS